MDFSQNEKIGIAIQIPKIQNPKSKTLYELPISNIRLKSCVFPLGGGCYFRLIPFLIYKLGVQTILKKEKAYLFYMHPWEIDTEQPKVRKASYQYKFRHYLNLNKTASRLSKLFDTFHQSRFITCRQYLEEILNSA
jgi:hypothetical protein